MSDPIPTWKNAPLSHVEIDIEWPGKVRQYRVNGQDFRPVLQADVEFRPGALTVLRVALPMLTGHVRGPMRLEVVSPSGSQFEQDAEGRAWIVPAEAAEQPASPPRDRETRRCVCFVAVRDMVSHHCVNCGGIPA